MRQECVLSILVTKDQRSRLQNNGFLEHSCFPFRLIFWIMKLHSQTPNESRTSLIDFGIERSRLHNTNYWSCSIEHICFPISNFTRRLSMGQECVLSILMSKVKVTEHWWRKTVSGSNCCPLNHGTSHRHVSRCVLSILGPKKVKIIDLDHCSQQLFP